VSGEVGVVLTGGDFQALGVLRVLARQGIPVVVLDSDFCIARYSRYKHVYRRCPPPANESAFVEFLLRLGREKKIIGSVLLPNSDEAVYAISRNKAALSEFYRVPTPSWEVTQKVYIKKQTYEIARSIGVPVPELICADSLDSL
jgi:D-aspartate ligase